jgi:hypothetical protein
VRVAGRGVWRVCVGGAPPGSRCGSGCVMMRRGSGSEHAGGRAPARARRGMHLSAAVVTCSGSRSPSAWLNRRTRCTLGFTYLRLLRDGVRAYACVRACVCVRVCVGVVRRGPG